MVVVRIAIGLLVFALPLGGASAATIEVMPGDDLQGAIASLEPGDELVLHGGLYEVTARFGISVSGTEAAPIVIRAAAGEVPHIHRPNANQNIMDIDFAEHLELRGIEFSGGSAGVRISDATHLTIADCEIHGTNDVALRANDVGITYEQLHILRNHIHDTNNTGEGMYLGCNQDGCRIANSVIELNYIHNLDGPGIEQGDGIEIKEGSYGNVVRDNVIHDVNYPCILTYAAAGNGPANVIERNVLWNCGGHGIQSAADAVIRNNIILGAAGSGIAMQPHQSGAPSNLVVVHNTILNPGGDAMSVRDATAEVIIANNAVYSQSGLAIFVNAAAQPFVALSANVGQGGVGGLSGYVDGTLEEDFVNAHFGGGPPIDVFPAAGGALVGAADPDHLADDDFNTTPRGDSLDVGAYVFDPDGNPGWDLDADFKEFPDEPPGGEDDTGGSPDDDTGDSPGPPDGTSRGDADSGTGTDPTSGGATSGGTSSTADEDGSGCSCRTSTDRRPAWMLAPILLVARRRRSRAAGLRVLRKTTR